MTQVVVIVRSRFSSLTAESEAIWLSTTTLRSTYYQIDIVFIAKIEYFSVRNLIQVEVCIDIGTHFSSLCEIKQGSVREVQKVGLTESQFLISVQWSFTTRF